MLHDTQMTLLGEAGGAGATGGGGGDALKSRFESKINTATRDCGRGGEAGGGGVASQSVRNDIRKSEKTGEKASRHTGRDDRATVEQVSLLFFNSYRWFFVVQVPCLF